jgi:SAM-dependent methyltransferase
MNSRAQSIHEAAASGYAQAADSYVKGRPGYPVEIQGWLRDRLDLRAGKVAVDLGAGTGKFTPYLTATGARVIAVEPVRAMLDRLTAKQPRVEAIAGTADAIALPDGSVDAVVCAQSFHWFATPRALAEIRRALRPGGRLGLVWNVRDDRVGWIARLNEIVNQAEGDTPRYARGQWRTLFPFPGFSPLHEHHFSHAQTGPHDDLILHRVRSTSFIAALPPEARDAIEAQLKTLIASAPNLRGHNEITIPYDTVAFDAIKTNESSP